MKLTRWYSLFIIIIISGLVLIFIGACKKSEETPPPDSTRTQIERAVGYTAATVVSAAGGVYGSAIGIITSNAAGVDETMIGYSYDPATGWWSLSISLENSQSANIKVKFLDASGDFHKYFGLDTTQIQSTGEGSGPNGSFTYDFTFTGIGLTNSTFVVNGSGTATYMGTTSSFMVTDMTIEKLGDGIPESGGLAVVVSDVTFTITFNGSEKVQVTYSYKGFSYTITIDLKTGEIS